MTYRFETVEIEPMGKPRMTQRDKWKKRPVVLRYHEYKDILRKAANKQNIDLSSGVARIRFVLQFPKSYSKKKCESLNGKPHQEKPDIDNLTKAVFDTLCKNDSHIYKSVTEKIWGYSPCIIFAIEE